MAVTSDSFIDDATVDVEDEAVFRRTVGRRVAAARRTHEWTQERLARESGISRNFISGLERGLHGVNLLHLRRLAIVLGIDVHDLVPGRCSERPDRCDP